jgi:hypothetical protein
MNAGPSESWTLRLSGWAKGQRDVVALIQIGSRVQPGANTDEWSDYDYQLVTTQPWRYEDGRFASELGNCWAVAVGKGAITDITKITAVFEGAVEADFIVIGVLRLCLASTLLRWPAVARLCPRRIRADIRDLRVVAGRGWKIIKGAPAWERRYLRITRCEITLTVGEFEGICSHFWTQAIWTAKKVKRGEFLAAARSIHRLLAESTYRLLQEEALIRGRVSRPECRYAEMWLSPERLSDLQITTRRSREDLALALQRYAELFAEVSQGIAQARSWPCSPYTEVREWLTHTLSTT